MPGEYKKEVYHSPLKITVLQFFLKGTVNYKKWTDFCFLSTWCIRIIINEKFIFFSFFTPYDIFLIQIEQLIVRPFEMTNVWDMYDYFKAKKTYS